MHLSMGLHKPPTTIITTCYEILRKTGHFCTALEKWNKKLPQDKTWINFQLHFRAAACCLREFATDTTGDAGYSTQMVNEITQGVANLIQGNQSNNEQAQAFLMNMSNAVSQNQNALPQLFNSVSRINDTVTDLQQAVQTMNAARQPTGNGDNPNDGQVPPPPATGNQW